MSETARVRATKAQLRAAEAAYTRQTLKLYDPFVHLFSNHLLWRCPTRLLIEQYNQNLSPWHLDVGVGTGYLLNKAKFPVVSPEITLLDLNKICLEVAAARLARYNPRTVQANIFEPLSPDIGLFSSISMSYLLHCLPGPIASKAVVFDRLRSVMAEDAVVFGATIFQRGVRMSKPAAAVMKYYNDKGIVSNRDDWPEDLERALMKRFEVVEVELHGMVALFEASKPI